MKTNFSFLIILKQCVGFDSQCLSSPRPSSQNLRVHHEIVPLKINFNGFHNICCLLTPEKTGTSKDVTEFKILKQRTF